MPPIPKPKLAPAPQAAAMAAKGAVVQGTKPAPKYRHDAKMLDENNPLKEDLAKQLLGWEDEETYKTRIGGTSGGKGVPGFGREFLLQDLFNKRVRCWNNTKNRPFDISWARALAQDILFSGPGLPPERRRWQLNGETIVIGKYGQVLSGQHRLVALILACQQWRREKEKWQHIWPTEPTMTTVLIFGIDESQAVTRTLDNVKPRSLGDVFFTSELFASLSLPDRKECSRMLATAVDWLWRRTAVKQGAGVKYQTHGESVDFLDRHSDHLLHAIKEIFKLNSGDGRAITNLNLSAGQAAGMLYFMGSSMSEYETYQTTRSEVSLDWTLWPRALEFWKNLADNKAGFLSVRNVLASLMDADTGAQGRSIEKAAVLAKAWGLYANKQEIKESLIKLDYEADDDGVMQLAEAPTFGGIDQGEGKKLIANEPAVTEEEVKAAAEAEKARHMAEMQKKVETKKPTPAPKK